jgi:hypothetical protein
MTEHDHQGCDDHQSVMRGVCYCPTTDTVFVNPMLFRTGEVFPRETSEIDLETGDAVEMLLAIWFDVLDEKFVQITSNTEQMSGMAGECEQVPGNPGFELVARVV